MDEKANTRAPVSVAEAVDLICSEMDEGDKQILRDVEDRQKLYRFHFGLGRTIRNKLGLWTGSSALLADCRRVAIETGQELTLPKEMHPDDASHTIIVALWKKLKEAE